ncbi:hypothetical protein QE152_g36648 [Popillia japonica]|uniref:Serine protease n=1 Tax=Popillia japonica TaxID=7064 RepID=A0AAW1ID81_POPJA
MNVLYGILLINLLLTPISVYGCNEINYSLNVNINGRPLLPLQYLVGLSKWSDGEVEIYCTGAIVRVYGVYIVVLANHECLKHFVSYKDIKLVKWNIAKITTLGKVSHIEVRDKFILLTPSYDFIHPKEYIEYNPSGNTKSTDLAFVEYTNSEVETVLITLTEREDPYPINNSTPAIPYDTSTSPNHQIDNSTPAIPYDTSTSPNYQINNPKPPAIPYDNSTSSNTVKIYTSEIRVCYLNRGYLILNAKRHVLCGIGLPLSDSNCYKEFIARHIQEIDMIGILQYMYQINTFPKITTSYTCMVVAFSAVVVL